MWSSSTGVRMANVVRDGKRSGTFLSLLALVQAVTVCLVLVGCGGEATTVVTPQDSSRAVSFTTKDGEEIMGRLFGQGQTGVVLSHMFPADQKSWWEFAQVLADQGYMALAFDFRGYGESGGERRINLIDWDLEAATEYLRDQDVSTVFLIGASMGGTASLKVAATQGERIAGVVSLSAPEEFRGISVKADRVRVPVLLMATAGDRSAKKSVGTMIRDGIVGGPELTESVVYESGRGHGTRIFEGEHADEARQRILAFLEARSP